MQITELVPRRTDLSTFVVHLTRSAPGETGKDRLKGILAAGQIEARSAYGHAVQRVAGNVAAENSQRVVCFTETPLEHLYLLTKDIDGRQFSFEPYGLAFTKRVARSRGANPVWYIDITPGHDWLTKPINKLIEQALAAGNFEDSDIAKITPFIEQMGTQPGNYRKEFWWEREWRHRGPFDLPQRAIGICPAADMQELGAHAQQHAREVVWIDPAWGLEEIIGRLAGFAADEVNVLA